MIWSLSFVCSTARRSERLISIGEPGRRSTGTDLTSQVLRCIIVTFWSSSVPFSLEGRGSRFSIMLFSIAYCRANGKSYISVSTGDTSTLSVSAVSSSDTSASTLSVSADSWFRHLSKRVGTIRYPHLEGRAKFIRFDSKSDADGVRVNLLLFRSWLLVIRFNGCVCFA